MLGCQKYLSVVRSDGNDQRQDEGGGKVGRFSSPTLRHVTSIFSLLFLRHLGITALVGRQVEEALGTS